MTDLIENYEDKSPTELENEISDADFSESELEELREHEAETEDRGMVLETIDAELAAFETEQAGATDFVSEVGTEEVAAADADVADEADEVDETDDTDDTADDSESVEAGTVDVSDAETELEDDEDDEPEFVDIKSDGHHYAGGHFFDEIRGEKKEGVRYNARVKKAEEKGRLKVLD